MTASNVLQFRPRRDQRPTDADLDEARTNARWTALRRALSFEVTDDQWAELQETHGALERCAREAGL